MWSGNNESIMYGIDCFRSVEVNLLSLPQMYRNDFIKHTNDHTAIDQMFGSIIAWIFRAASCFDETLAHNMILDQIKENQENIENYFRRDWFVYDNNHNFVGSFGVRTHNPQSGFLYVGKRVLEISATISSEFRGKGVAKKLAPVFMSELKRVYPDDVFVLSTIPNNAIVSHLATINGFTKVHTYTEYVVFVPIIFNLYTLK